MRVVVHGQQAFGKRVLEALLERGEDIIAVYCAPEKEGQRTDPLKESALEHNLRMWRKTAPAMPTPVMGRRGAIGCRGRNCWRESFASM